MQMQLLILNLFSLRRCNNSCPKLMKPPFFPLFDGNAFSLTESPCNRAMMYRPFSWAFCAYISLPSLSFCPPPTFLLSIIHALIESHNHFSSIWLNEIFLWFFFCISPRSGLWYFTPKARSLSVMLILDVVQMRRRRLDACLIRIGAENLATWLHPS